MKYLTYILFFVFTCTQVVAQDADLQKKWDKIASLKIEFINEKLDLPTFKQEKFRPVYNAYQQELNTLYHLRRVSRGKNKNNPQKQVDEDFIFESKILELKKYYRKKFDTVLNSEELKTLYNAEREFKDELIKRLRDKK